MEHSIMLGTYAALNLYPRLLPEDDTPNYESFRWFIGYCTLPVDHTKSCDFLLT